MQLREIVSKNLRALRNQVGITQSELAKRLKKSDYRYISQMETQPQNVTVDMIEDLARALNVQPMELLRTGPELPRGPRPEAVPGLDEAIQVLKSYRSLA